MSTSRSHGYRPDRGDDDHVRQRGTPSDDEVQVVSGSNIDKEDEALERRRKSKGRELYHARHHRSASARESGAMPPVNSPFHPGKNTIARNKNVNPSMPFGKSGAAVSTTRKAAPRSGNEHQPHPKDVGVLKSMSRRPLESGDPSTYTMVERPRTSQAGPSQHHRRDSSEGHTSRRELQGRLHHSFALEFHTPAGSSNPAIRTPTRGRADPSSRSTTHHRDSSRTYAGSEHSYVPVQDSHFTRRRPSGSKGGFGRHGENDRGPRRASQTSHTSGSASPTKPGGDYRILGEKGKQRQTHDALDSETPEEVENPMGPFQAELDESGILYQGCKVKGISGKDALAQVADIDADVSPPRNTESADHPRRGNGKDRAYVDLASDRDPAWAIKNGDRQRDVRKNPNPSSTSPTKPNKPQPGKLRKETLAPFQNNTVPSSNIKSRSNILAEIDMAWMNLGDSGLKLLIDLSSATIERQEFCIWAKNRRSYLRIPSDMITLGRFLASTDQCALVLKLQDAAARQDAQQFWRTVCDLDHDQFGAVTLSLVFEHRSAEAKKLVEEFRGMAKMEGVKCENIPEQAASMVLSDRPSEKAIRGARTSTRGSTMVHEAGPSRRGPSPEKRSQRNVDLPTSRTRSRESANEGPRQTTLDFSKAKEDKGTPADKQKESTNAVTRRSSRISGNDPIKYHESENGSQSPKKSTAKPLSLKERNVLLFNYPLHGRANVQITRGERYRVENLDFLNDTLIEFGLRHVLEPLSAERRNKVHLFNSFFYNKISGRKQRKGKVDPDGESGLPHWPGYESVKKWTRKADIFNKDFLIIPINEDYHWFLAIIVHPARILRERSPTPESSSVRDILAENSDTHATRSKGSPAVFEYDSDMLPPTVRPADKQELHLADVSMHTNRSEDPIDSLSRGDGDVDMEQDMDPKLFDPQRAVSTERDHQVNGMSQSMRNMSLTPNKQVEGLQPQIDGDESFAADMSVTEKDSEGKGKPGHQILSGDKAWILTFDSLGGQHRAVSTHLNQWLEYEAHDKEVIKHSRPTKAEYLEAKVPSQPNFSDCGLYLVHYTRQLLNHTEEVMEFIQRPAPRIKAPERKAWEEDMRTVWREEDTKNMRHDWLQTIDDTTGQYRSLNNIPQPSPKSVKVDEAVKLTAEKDPSPNGMDRNDVSKSAPPTVPSTQESVLEIEPTAPKAKTPDPPSTSQQGSRAPMWVTGDMGDTEQGRSNEVPMTGEKQSSSIRYAPGNDVSRNRSLGQIQDYGDTDDDQDTPMLTNRAHGDTPQYRDIDDPKINPELSGHGSNLGILEHQFSGEMPEGDLWLHQVREQEPRGEFDQADSANDDSNGNGLPSREASNDKLYSPSGDEKDESVEPTRGTSTRISEDWKESPAGYRRKAGQGEHDDARQKLWDSNGDGADREDARETEDVFELNTVFSSVPPNGRVATVGLSSPLTSLPSSSREPESRGSHGLQNHPPAIYAQRPPKNRDGAGLRAGSVEQQRIPDPHDNLVSDSDGRNPIGNVRDTRHNRIDLGQDSTDETPEPPEPVEDKDDSRGPEQYHQPRRAHEVAHTPSWITPKQLDRHSQGMSPSHPTVTPSFPDPYQQSSVHSASTSRSAPTTYSGKRSKLRALNLISPEEAKIGQSTAGTSKRSVGQRDGDSSPLSSSPQSRKRQKQRIEDSQLTGHRLSDGNEADVEGPEPETNAHGQGHSPGQGQGQRRLTRSQAQEMFNGTSKDDAIIVDASDEDDEED